MMTLHRHPLASGIVVRLRFALAIILVVLLGVSVTGHIQIRSLNKAVEELTVSSIATFVHTEESERSLTSLLVLLQRADSADRADALAEIERAVTERLIDLRQELRSLQQVRPGSERTDRYSDALEDIETNVRQVFALRHAILMQEQTLESSRLVLDGLRQETLTLLEEMSFGAAEAINQISRQREGASAADFDAFVQAYSQNLVVSNAISSILIEVEAIIDSAVSIRYILDEEELARMEDAIRLRSRNAVVLLSQLPETASRMQLARILVDIRQTLFDDGIVQVVEDIQRRQGLLDRVNLDQLEVVRNISDISREFVLSSRTEIETAEGALANASDRLALSWTVAAIVSTLVIFATLIFIVERQINRRVGKLTTAVLEISAGDVKHRVGVEGDDEFGKIAGALEVFKENAEELRRSNEELEKFAYVAAHDLRSPLRAIQDLANWTVEDPDSVLSEDSLENMALLQNRIARLSQLLADLLDYSRVGSEGSDIDEVSLSQIVKDTADMLDPDGAFDVVLTCNADRVSTCATPLRQVLLNLMNNAIKHHDKAAGHISIDIQDDGNRLRCSVTDDGAGIPTEYHERIFGLFQTLRPRDEVEGSGLGLAIVRKLLEHHGGGISVTSDPQTARGTKFTFDLPSKAQNQPEMERAA